MVMKSTIFWDNALFATYFHGGFILSLVFDPADGRDMFH
jgi:hypothetical protein